MTWHETTDPEQWLAAVGDLLFPEPGRHTVALTVAHQAPPGTRFAWWHDGSDVTGAALVCEGFPALLSVVPDEALRPLGDLWEIRRLSGPTQLAVQAAKVLAAGRRVEVLGAERLFRLTELATPTVPGRARPASDDDAELLVAWLDAFTAEAGIVVPIDARKEVAERIPAGRLTVWDDGSPVAMAGRHGVAYGGLRIGPVYTPPELRGRGYGAAVTAAVTQEALDLGAREVVLYTDLTNPTSNALYPRLGYRPVEDRAVLEISP